MLASRPVPANPAPAAIAGVGTPASQATDVLVIGGGAAGLTAALVLARARHQVTVIDDQTYRNATVAEFHGFPTRDATAPNQFRSDAISELQTYGVAMVNSAVIGVSATDRSVTHRTGRRHHDRSGGDAARHRGAR